MEPSTPPAGPAPEPAPPEPTAPSPPAVALVSAPAPASAPSPAAEPSPWPLPLLILIRIAFIYEVLFSLPFPIGRFAGMSGILVRTRPVMLVVILFTEGWDRIVAWAGPALFGVHVDTSTHNYLSGDRLYDWVRLGVIALAAVGGGLLWSVLDRRRRYYRRLYDAFRIYLRMVVGIAMLSYGLMKVFRGQLPWPYLGRMVERFGDASPMGLLWTTLGFSTPYVIFAGSMETLGGLLIFFRRTTTLGCLVVIAVMTNVVMFNLCFDVPVKIYSANIVLMAAILLLPDVRRLTALFLLGRAAPARVETPEDTAFGNRPRMLRAAWWIKVAFLATALYDYSSESLGHVPEIWEHEDEPAPFGNWQVTHIVRDGQEIPLTADDPDSPRWMTLYHMGAYPVAEITTQDGTDSRAIIQHDPASQRFMLPDRIRGGSVYQYALPSGAEMVLSGVMEGHPVQLELHRAELKSFKLLSRGFHWVNEYPFNQ